MEAASTTVLLRFLFYCCCYFCLHPHHFQLSLFYFYWKHCQTIKMQLEWKQRNEMVKMLAALEVMAVAQERIASMIGRWLVFHWKPFASLFSFCTRRPFFFDLLTKWLQLKFDAAAASSFTAQVFHHSPGADAASVRIHWRRHSAIDIEPDRLNSIRLKWPFNWTPH